MKTTILTAAMMILLTAAAVNAAPDSTLVTPPVEKTFKAVIRELPSNVIEFRVAKPADEKISLIIYSEKNNKVYQRNLHKGSGIALDCDMKEMKTGTYTCVILRGDKEVVRKSIAID